jgi:hypothetical protein
MYARTIEVACIKSTTHNPQNKDLHPYGSTPRWETGTNTFAGSTLLSQHSNQSITEAQIEMMRSCSVVPLLLAVVAGQEEEQ